MPTARPIGKILILSMLLVSCSKCGASKGGPPSASAVSSTTIAAEPETAKPPGTPARFAYATGPSLCVESALPTALGGAACADLPAAIEQFEWVGGERIAALLASGDVMLVGVARGREGTKKVPRPAASTWKRPPPRDSTGQIQNGAGPSDRPHLFVKGDEIWLARCPWWFPFDAGWCHEWVSARLYPTPGVDVSSAEPPGFRQPSKPQFDAKIPADVKITVKDAEPGKAPSVVCERGGARAIFVPEGNPSDITVKWTWIPESASFYLANVISDNGEAVFVATYLMKACEPKPVTQLSSVIVGPFDCWIHDRNEAWVVRRGDREIGTFAGTQPKFAP